MDDLEKALTSRTVAALSRRAQQRLASALALVNCTRCGKRAAADDRVITGTRFYHAACDDLARMEARAQRVRARADATSPAAMVRRREAAAALARARAFSY